MNKRLLAVLGGAGILAAAISFALAQTYPPSFLSTISNTTDAIPDIPGGHASAQSQYVTPAQISNAPQYTKQTITGTTVTYTGLFANAQTWLIVVLTSTLAYDYVTAAPSPSDGARECTTASGGAITGLNFTANTGQTVTGGNNISLAANATACFTYSASNLTWDRS